jgi:hypothetical protein
MFPKTPFHHSFHPSMFPRDLSIIPFISSFSLMLQHQVSAGNGGVFSMFPKKFPSFSSSWPVPKRFFHHSLHLFVLLDALMTGLCWKRWCILNVPKKTFPSFSSPQHVPGDLSIIPFISSFALMLQHQVSAGKGSVFSMFSKKTFHHSLNLSMLPRDFSIIPFISWFSLMLQQQVSAGKRWHILNVPKKTFPSFFSSQHYPWRFHLESRLKMVEKIGLKTEEIVRWPGTESTLLLNLVWSQRMELLQCDHVCKNSISYEEEQKKDNGV